MTDWIASITDPTLRRIAQLEHDMRKVNRRCDAYVAIARVQSVAIIVLAVTPLVLRWMS